MLDCGGWDAWRNEMPGSDDPNLHVTGECRLPSSSIDLKLEVTNQGINPNPEVLLLALTSSKPDVGDDVMTVKQVTWEGRADRAKRVHIRGEADVAVEVRIAS
jgi:hypothetical protein